MTALLNLFKKALPWRGIEAYLKRRTKHVAVTMYKVVNDHFPFHPHELFQTTSQVRTLVKGLHS